MKIFSGSASRDLTKKVADHLRLPVATIEHHVFPDGEQRVMLKESVVNEDTVVLQSTGMPTDRHYMELFFMIDALRRSGAKSTTVVVPYLGYQRQDHVFREGEARSLEVVIRFMEQAGGTRFIGLDFHSVKIPEVFLKPVIPLSALSLFAEKIKQEQLLDNDTVLVSPDMGGIRRLDILSDLLGGVPTVSVEKNRDLITGDINAGAIHGMIKKKAIILDDMISSGKTIVQAAKVLQHQGVVEMFVFATHAIFSEDASTILQGSPVQKVYVTDTIHVPEIKQFAKLQVISVAEMIAEALREV